MIVEMFPAKNGDAFLIRFDNKKNILIDMGYDETYRDYIKSRLIELNKEGQAIDLLLITHIDEDHIGGAITFLNENGLSEAPKIIEVKEIWHNAYRHLQFEKKSNKLNNRFENRQLNDIKLKNSMKITNNEDQDISAEQGSTLASLLYQLQYEKKWNLSFDNEAINIDFKKFVELDQIKIHVISPDTKKLEKLSNIWKAKLQSIDMDFNLGSEKIFDDAYEMYIKYLKDNLESEELEDISAEIEEFEKILNGKLEQMTRDNSKSNGSAIAIIIEYEEKKLLFLGDSHEDIIIRELLKYKEEKGNLDFDVIKLSHHGSLKNNFKLLEVTKSKKYLISTNGRHDHPSKIVLAKILKENLKNKEFYFNHKVEVSKFLDNKDLMEKYNYSIKKGNGNEIIKIEV